MYVCTHIDGEHMKRRFGVCGQCGSPTVAIGGKWHMRMLVVTTRYRTCEGEEAKWRGRTGRAHAEKRM